MREILFPSQLFVPTDSGGHHKVAIGPIDDAAKEGDIHSGKRGIQDHGRGRAGDLYLTRGQGRYRLSAGAGLNDFNTDAVLAKKTLLDTHPQSQCFFIEDRFSDAHCGQFRSLGGETA